MTGTLVVTCRVPCSDLDELKLTAMDHTVGVTGPEVSGTSWSCPAKPTSSRWESSSTRAFWSCARRYVRPSDVASGERRGRERRRSGRDRNQHGRWPTRRRAQRVARGVVVEGRKLSWHLQLMNERRQPVDEVRGHRGCRRHADREGGPPSRRPQQDRHCAVGEREQHCAERGRARWPAEMSMPSTRAPTQSASQSTNPSPTTSAASATAFSSTTASARRGSRAAGRACPAPPRRRSLPRPLPIAATSSSSGTISEKSSIPRYPAADE